MAASGVSTVEAGQAYLELQHQLHRIVDRVMCDAGLSLARVKVLRQLAEQGSMNQARLACLLGFAPRSVTDTVDVLEREGLVTRQSDPDDRRARIVALTPAGCDAWEIAMKARKIAMDEIFGGLSAEERATLVALCNSIQNHISSGEKRS